MIHIRRSEERGHANHGWLDSHHTFSFAGYYDPRHMGFRSLRVINEDRVAPETGFGTHPHQDMEIISYVLSGELTHRDSMDNKQVLRAGDVQHMSAGSGVRHSEMNESRESPVHFLQIWIEPEARGLEPIFGERSFSDEEKKNRLRRIASPRGADDSLPIRQDAEIFATMLEAGSRVEHDLRPGRHAWVQVARGELTVNGESLKQGDAAALSDETSVVLEGRDGAEALLFDLA